MNSGNYLIDGDDGRHPFSPGYREETCDGRYRAPCICETSAAEVVEYCACHTPAPDPDMHDLCMECNRELPLQRQLSILKEKFMKETEEWKRKAEVLQSEVNEQIENFKN